jgi:NADPH-dependent glutamate synthase beta subunit-like oxidoreductase
MLDRELADLNEIGVEIHNSLGPRNVNNGNLTCVECSSVYDNQGNFCPEFDDSILKEIQFDYIIMAVGQEIEESLADYFQKIFGMQKIKVDPNTQLIEGMEKVYAGGDIIRGAGTVVEAVADGRRAANAIHKKLL